MLDDRHTAPSPTLPRNGGEPDPPGLAALRPSDVAAWVGAAGRPATAVPVMPAPPPDRTGAGRRVALVAGAVHRHPDLAGARVRAWSGGRDLAPDPRVTGLASLLVGQGVAHVRGLVPDAELLLAAVPDPQDVGADVLVARAVRWAVRSGADALVLPFARRRLGRRLTGTLHAALDQGVRVFAAAGDLGPDVLAFPASVTGVLAVTAHDGAGVLPRCSARADLAAPGIDVPAAGLRGPARLSGSAVAAVLAAGCHLAWCGAGAEAGQWDRVALG